MISLGIDPGTYSTGVVALEDGKEKPIVLLIRTIKLSASARRPERLAMLASVLEGILLRLKPDIVVVEAGSVHRWARAALALSEARGVAMALGERAGARVYEVHVQQARKSLGVAKFGQRREEGKEAVDGAVRALLGMSPATDDEADAAALAWWGLWGVPPSIES